VELHARLHLIDRPLRYGTLFSGDGDNWQLGESAVGKSMQPTAGVGKASTGEDLADHKVGERSMGCRGSWPTTITIIASKYMPLLMHGFRKALDGSLARLGVPTIFFSVV